MKRIYRIELVFTDREIEVPDGADTPSPMIRRLLYEAIDPELDIDFEDITKEEVR